MGDRLTNVGSDGEIWITDNDDTRRLGQKEAAYQKLKKYEDLEEQGLLLKLPCKLGDVVYDVVFCDDKRWHIFEMQVCSINPFGDVRKGKAWNVYLECVDDCSKAYRSFYDFGKTVFFTQGEAEEVLKKTEIIEDNFKCKAEKGGYCNQWLRECVSWNNCNLSGYGAPCPGCVASSPLDREECKTCKWQTWKKENYM